MTEKKERDRGIYICTYVFTSIMYRTDIELDRFDKTRVLEKNEREHCLDNSICLM